MKRIDVLLPAKNNTATSKSPEWRMILDKLSSWRFDRVLAMVDRSEAAPVVINQIGKVGSSTMRRSLKRVGKTPVLIIRTEASMRPKPECWRVSSTCPHLR